ncbi:MAG: recombinase family protein, partial [Sandaracinaceae bacterium]
MGAAESTRTVRCGLYARVSSDSQDTAMQLDELRAEATRRGRMIAGEYVALGITGANDSRPALDRLMKAARDGRLDVVAVR